MTTYTRIHGEINVAVSFDFQVHQDMCKYDGQFLILFEYLSGQWRIISYSLQCLQYAHREYNFSCAYMRRHSVQSTILVGYITSLNICLICSESIIFVIDYIFIFI